MWNRCAKTHRTLRSPRPNNQPNPTAGWLPQEPPAVFCCLSGGGQLSFPKSFKNVSPLCIIILGFGSANPCSENPYDGTVCPTYQGTVMAVFRGSGHARFTAEGLPPLELDF